MADVAVDPECNDPKELFGRGVRAYILQDYDSAVAALSKSSEIIVEREKDEFHESLGEVYLYYGKALLGLAREQNEALGDAVPKNSADESENEDEEEQDEGIETEESEENKTEETSAASSLNGDAEKPECDRAQPESSGASSSQCNGEPGPSTSNEAEEEATDEQQNRDDDATDLQLAWEVLEMAKKIFQKQGIRKSVAETLVVLGEISLESENFESAIKDIKQGLDVQKELFSKDSRAVAETLYKLGMAYSTNSQIDEAIGSFNESLEYLRNRINTLEEIKEKTQENKDEIDEIKSLIPDIEDKIADMRVYKEEAIKQVAEAIKEPEKPAAQDGAGSSKQVTNISHLVKRKRKLEDEEKSNAEAPAKKPAA